MRSPVCIHSSATHRETRTSHLQHATYNTVSKRVLESLCTTGLYQLVYIHFCTTVLDHMVDQHCGGMWFLSNIHPHTACVSAWWTIQVQFGCSPHAYYHELNCCCWSALNYTWCLSVLGEGHLEVQPARHMDRVVAPALRKLYVYVYHTYTIQVTKAALSLSKSINDRRKDRGLQPRPVRAAVISFPNVAKSALINRFLKRRACESVRKPVDWIWISNGHCLAHLLSFL